MLRNRVARRRRSFVKGTVTVHVRGRRHHANRRARDASDRPQHSPQLAERVLCQDGSRAAHAALWRAFRSLTSLWLSVVVGFHQRIDEWTPGTQMLGMGALLRDTLLTGE